MRKARGQCGQAGLLRGGKFCRDGINCREREALPEHEISRFYWVFGDGTAFADRVAWKLGRSGRLLSEFRSMMFALGAVSSAIGALKSLTSSISPSSKSTGFGQSSAGPFGIASSDSTSASSTSPAAPGGGSQIASATMSALIAAQSQSSTGTAPHVASSGDSGDAGGADGSTATASGAATSSYNLIEQMIQRQAQAISFSAVNPSLSLSA
jgi:hypothetical protein